MIVTDNDIVEIEEEISGEDGEIELEHGSDNGDDEEGVEIDDEEAQPQDEPEDDSQSVEESV